MFGLDGGVGAGGSGVLGDVGARGITEASAWLSWALSCSPLTLADTSTKRGCAACKAAEASPMWKACDDIAACSAWAMVLRISAALAPKAASEAISWGM